MGGFENALRALGEPNYRAYTIGNSISLIGTWLQRVADRLAGLAAIPLHDLARRDRRRHHRADLLLSPLAGSLADRNNRVRMIWWSQIATLAVATVLAVLTYTGTITIIGLFVLALALGSANALNQPARLALVSNLVPAAAPRLSGRA